MVKIWPRKSDFIKYEELLKIIEVIKLQADLSKALHKSLDFEHNVSHLCNTEKQ